jgi:replicative DNA helicase
MTVVVDFPEVAARPVPGGPHNLEAEQAILGAIMGANAAIERVPERLKPEHFHEPFHGRLFGEMATRIGNGQLAEPIGLMERFKADPSFLELGGLRFFAELIDKAPMIGAVRGMGEIVHDLAVRRELMRLYSEAVGSARDNGETPALEQLEAVEAQLYALAEGTAQGGGFKAFADHLTDALDGFARAYENEGGVSGLATSLTDLDQKLGGLHPSDLIIVAGRPSSGKTALATNIAYRAARADKKVAFFSLEMSGGQLAGRLLSDASGISSDRLRRGEIRPHEYALVREAGLEIKSIPLHINDTGGISITKLSAQARRLKRSSGLDLIVVDYLQLVTTDGPGDGNRAVEVSRITQGLKSLAKDLNVPVVALSQLSRKVEDREDKRPQLSDLRESGSIEQDADVVMFVFREEYYVSRAEPKPGTPKHLDWEDQMNECRNIAEVIIGKQRHGPIGTVRLHFNSDLVRFSNLAREGRYTDYSEAGARS